MTKIDYDPISDILHLELETIKEQLRKAKTSCPDCGQYAGTHLSMCESEEAN